MSDKQTISCKLCGCRATLDVAKATGWIIRNNRVFCAECAKASIARNMQ